MGLPVLSYERSCMARCHGNDVMAYTLPIPMHDKELAQTAGLLIVTSAVAPEALVLKGLSGIARGAWAARASRTAIPYWPPNRGFASPPAPTTLAPGTRIDRYGSELGTFASPAGTPFGARSLPPEAATRALRTYEVVAPLPAQSGTTSAWFGQLGGGMQYEFGQSIERLVELGFLRRVP